MAVKSATITLQSNGRGYSKSVIGKKITHQANGTGNIKSIAKQGSAFNRYELLAARPHLTMHAMDGLLLEDVPLRRIADAVGTPTWVYGAGTMRARYRALAQAR